jgi:hypothetical protein
MSDLMTNCLAKIKKLFADDDTTEKNSRIESAKITSNRLQALQRMRTNSPNTPNYKLQDWEENRSEPTGARKQLQINDVDLDFGMNIKG